MVIVITAVSLLHAIFGMVAAGVAVHALFGLCSGVAWLFETKARREAKARSQELERWSIAHEAREREAASRAWDAQMALYDTYTEEDWAKDEARWQRQQDEWDKLGLRRS